MVSDGGLTVRHADADADGAHMDGMNGAAAAGVNGEGVNVNDANGRSRGHERRWCKGHECGHNAD